MSYNSVVIPKLQFPSKIYHFCGYVNFFIVVFKKIRKFKPNLFLKVIKLKTLKNVDFSLFASILPTLAPTLSNFDTNLIKFALIF